jgi:hypothetical protein
MNPTNKNFFDTLAEVRGYYQESAKINHAQEEETWNSLSTEQQLDVFCAVVRRIVQAELVDDGTYRHALYNVFKFGPEAYGRGMDAGYFDLHNSIIKDDRV